MNIYDVLRAPVMTEKSVILKEEGNKYVFRVHPDANKYQIRQAVEQAFKVKVVKVNTMNVTGKNKRMGRFQGKKSDWKKAIVTLPEGQSIEYFEGA
ncbi:MAG: 50S ribosomal protein L23 [bacterium]|jgi:large subunit ribosomal protein L23